jgi:hypothetical protein
MNKFIMFLSNKIVKIKFINEVRSIFTFFNLSITTITIERTKNI